MLNPSKRLLEDAEQYQCRAADDVEKRELELTCRECGQWLTDIQPGDSLGTLVKIASGHVCEFNDEDPLAQQMREAHRFREHGIREEP